MENSIITKDLHLICKSGDENKINQLGEVVEKMLCYDGDTDKKVFHKMFWELKEIINGKILTQELVESAVAMMTPCGEMWNMTETQHYMDNNKVKCHLYEFYYVCNMLYNTHEYLRNNDELLLKASLEWINDNNMKSDKTYEYIKHISLYGRK